MGKKNAATMAPSETRKMTGNNTQRKGRTREHQMTHRNRKPASAWVQSQQQHTPAHPTAQDTHTTPAPHNRHTTTGKKKGGSGKKKEKEGRKKNREGEGRRKK